MPVYVEIDTPVPIYSTPVGEEDPELISPVTTWRLSTEDVSDDHFWDGQIVGIDAISHAIDTDYGGYGAIEFGSMRIAADQFDDPLHWPPHVVLPCRVYFGQTEVEKRLVLDVTLHRRSISPEYIEYMAFDQPLDAVQLLTEAENYDGDTAPLPMAIGTVTHMKAVRLPDAGGGNQRYSLADIQGTAHTDWHVYDDGVDICSNVDNVAADVFELTAAPVGEVTLSGTGAVTTLVGLFTWACGAARLNLTLQSSLATDAALTNAVANQRAIKEALSSAACACHHFWYVLDGTLYLIDMSKDAPGIPILILDMEGDTLEDETGAEILADWDFDLMEIDTTDVGSDVDMSDAAPKRGASFSWTRRYAAEGLLGDSSTTALYIGEESLSQTVFSDYDHSSDDMEMDCWSEDRATISDRLSLALATIHLPRITLTLPIFDLLMAPALGQHVIYTDDRGVRGLTCDFRVRSVRHDYIGMTCTITGEGTLSA